jgi:tripartite-type tricarboxylate transporter receptor subunit TctC
MHALTRAVLLVLFGSWSFASVTMALAQDYPAKPVRLIVTSGAGSSPDIQARIFTAKLGELWGQPFVIENIAGAGGNIAAERAAKSPPDGYTLLYASAGPLQFNKSLYTKLGYDIVADFEPIMQVRRVPNILAVHPSVPVGSVEALIAYAKAHPGRLRFGSAGSGTSQHLSGELFKHMTGVDMVHVPYKSSAQMTTDLVSGQFELAFQNAPVILSYVRSRQVRALAVTTATRIPALPDIPTIAESGLLGFEIAGGSGLLVPRGTSAAIVAKIHADMKTVLAMPIVREQFAANGVDIVGNSREEFAAQIRSDIERWTPIVKASGARVD